MQRMSRTSIYALAFLAASVQPLCAQTQAPSSTPPCSQTAKPNKSQDKPQSGNNPCPPASGSSDPSAAERFPFPGQQDPPKPQSQPDAPNSAAPAGKPPSAADKFPFPTEPAPPMPGSDPESSSSSSSSSSDNPDDSPSADTPPGDRGDTPHPSARRRLPKIEKLQSDEERADEDLKVAKFYTDAGDLDAAYLRVRDAVKYLPSDPDTHFALAYVAQKLKKREEAIAEYNNYLQLAPDGVRIKDANKALKELQR